MESRSSNRATSTCPWSSMFSATTQAWRPRSTGIPATRRKPPNIVFADSDIDNAVKGAITGIFYGKGEVCNAGSRLFLESKVKDEFTEKLAARAAKMRPADPLDPKTRLGAIVSAEQMKTVLGYIEAGKKDGAKLVAGGNRVNVDGGNGFFIEPTIFGEVKNDMKIAREEIFGPVLSVLAFDDVDG